MDKLLREIQKARQHLESTEPEDDGLTEFPFAAKPCEMCYIDAETAMIVLDWLESLIGGKGLT